MPHVGGVGIATVGADPQWTAKGVVTESGKELHLRSTICLGKGSAKAAADLHCVHPSQTRVVIEAVAAVTARPELFCVI